MYNVASALKVLIRYFFIIPALQLEHYNKKSKFEYHFCLVEIAGADLFYSFTFLCYLIFFRFHAHIVALSKEQIFDFFTYIFFYLQRSLSRSSFFLSSQNLSLSEIILTANILWCLLLDTFGISKQNDFPLT
jgi:hypothetical protein